MKNIKLLVSLFLLLSGFVYSQTSVQSFQIPTQTEKFSARFTASASVDNANIGIGFAGQEIENWSGMNCIVSFGGSGNIVVRKGSAYDALVDYPFSAGLRYYFDMDIDIPNQTYSVSVRMEDDLTPTVLATDYAFRMDNFNDSITHFACKSSHGAQTGYVGVSDFQLSNTSQTSTTTFNQSINMLSGEFGAKVVATPLAASTGYVGFSASEIAGELDSLGVAIQFTDAGVIKVGNGGAFAADSVVNYIAGEPYLFLIEGNIDSLSYDVKVVTPDLAIIDLATGYTFGSSFDAEALNYLVTSTLADDQYITVDGVEAGTLTYEGVTPVLNSKFGAYSQAFTKSLTVRASNDGLNAAFGLNKNEALAWGDFNTIVNFQLTQSIDVRNGGAYEATGTTWEEGEVFNVQFDMDPALGKYSVSLDNSVYAEPTVVATGYDFRNTDGDTINYVTSKLNWGSTGVLVGGYLILNEVGMTMPPYPVNEAPTVDAVPDVKANAAELAFDIDLSGITDGGDGSQELTLSATSSNDSIASVVLDYTSSEATGTLTVTPIAEGNTTITVIVKDNGGADHEGVDSTVMTFDVDLASTEVTVNIAGVQSYQIPTQRGEFSARFTASASVDDANVGIGFGGEEIGNWSGMNCIVSFGGSGNIVVRNSGAYDALVDYPYVAGERYYFDMDIDVPNQTYSVSVRTKDELVPTVLATDYAFRTDIFHGSIAYFSCKSSHASQTGYVGVSDFQLSNTVQTNAQTFNKPINKLSGAFGVKAVATPLADSTGYLGLSSSELSDGELNMLGAAIQFTEAGQILVSNGSSYTADSTVNYVAGEPYLFLIDGDIDSSTYNVTVVTPDLSVIVLATGYQLGSSFSAESFNYLVSSTLADDQYITVDGVEAGTLTYEGVTPVLNSKIGSFNQAFTKSLTVRASGNGLNAAFGLNKNEALAWGDFNTIVNYQLTQSVDVRNGTAYESTGSTWEVGEVYKVQFDMDPAQAKYSVSLDEGIYGVSSVVATDYDFRNTDGDTISYMTSKLNWGSSGVLVGGYLILNDVAMTMPPALVAVPTIDAVDAVSAVVSDGAFEISLTGITDGDDGSQELTVTATSSSDSIATVAIDYTSADETGTLTVTPNTVGTVTVTVTVKGTNDSTMISFDVNLLSSADLSSAEVIEVELSPNPATDNIQLSNAESISSVEIYNSVGLKVIEKSASNETDILINVSSINTGIYLVVYYNKDGTRSVSRFVKE